MSEIKASKGATPIDEEQRRGLIPNITTQNELNEYEERNIVQAVIWANSSRIFKRDILSVTGLVSLHKKMFDQTWKWAGDFRVKDTNIGVDPRDIQNNLKILLDDVPFWADNNTYSIHEIAIRLHHRLVAIHPFPNGNGRHSRILTNYFLRFSNSDEFLWSSKDLIAEGDARDRYISALKKADVGEYQDLLAFALEP